MTTLTSLFTFEPPIWRGMEPGIVSERTSLRALVGVCGLLFATAAAITIVSCGSMSTMPAMSMPGGWTMSMTWMRMPEQSWLNAAAKFLCMWTLMMVAMMLPSLTPVLWHYRQSVNAGSGAHLNRLTALVGLGYFLVWVAFGVLIFPLGAAIAAAEMESTVLARSVPLTSGVAVLIAGVLQFTRWKAHHIAVCREVSEHHVKLTADAATAWRYGLHIGVHCALTCANLTAILLMFGVMDLRTMVLVTAAITIERVAGQRAIHAIGAVAVTVGLFLIAQAAGFSMSALGSPVHR